MQNQGRHKRGLPFVREAVGYNEFVFACPDISLLSATSGAAMSRRLVALLGVGWRARLPKKPVSNSADKAHGKQREKVLSTRGSQEQPCRRECS